MRKAEEEARHAKTPDVEPEAGAGGKGGGDGKKTKPKREMKCGEFGKYGELKKKTGDGKIDRGHIPSKAAWKARAQKLNFGKPLSEVQKRSIVGERKGISACISAYIKNG
ncbi:hypothetical protein FHS28_002766 [Roseateles terrae]|uniref:Uncharacterized protein n=1 Tax=Roseateles terrae TaxID=431060 RepID=A0ABR6GTD2_9BURK|nr:hypothetical protein [Roseateles terrae]